MKLNELPVKERPKRVGNLYRSIMGTEGKSEFPLVQQLLNLIKEEEEKLKIKKQELEPGEKLSRKDLKKLRYIEGVYANTGKALLSEIERLGYKIVI